MTRNRPITFAAILLVASVFWFGFTPEASADTYSTDTTIALTSPAINWTIQAGSAASSLTVSTGSIVVAVPAGSVFTMTSTARNFQYTGQTANAVINLSCNSGQVATMEVASSNASNQTLTITPADTQCTPSSSGSGGGRASRLPKNNLRDVTPVVADSILLQRVEPELASCSPYLVSYLQQGLSNPPGEVKKLQRFLHNKETGIFDKNTFDSVVRFQEKYKDDILKPWKISTGTGIVGNNTLKKINQLYCFEGSVSCPYFTKYLRRGAQDSEVARVKLFLKERGYLDSSNEIDHEFDQKTHEAIELFQAAYPTDILRPWGIESPTGYWYVTTKKKANELMGCKV